MQRGLLFGDLGLEFNQLLLVGRPSDAQVLAAQNGVSGDEIDHAFRMTFYKALRSGSWSLAWGISLFSQRCALQHRTLLQLGQKTAPVFVLGSKTGLQLVALNEHLQMFRAFFLKPQMTLGEANAAFLECQGSNPPTHDLALLITNDTLRMGLELTILERSFHLQLLTSASQQKLFGEYGNYAAELARLTKPE